MIFNKIRSKTFILVFIYFSLKRSNFDFELEKFLTRPQFEFLFETFFTRPQFEFKIYTFLI